MFCRRTYIDQIICLWSSIGCFYPSDVGILVQIPQNVLSLFPCLTNHYAYYTITTNMYVIVYHINTCYGSWGNFTLMFKRQHNYKNNVSSWTKYYLCLNYASVYSTSSPVLCRNYYHSLLNLDSILSVPSYSDWMFRCLGVTPLLSNCSL
jgi:hypothetical protein